MGYTVEEDLYTTADPLAEPFAGEVVKAGDPRAAYFLYGAGRELTDEEATKFGLSDGTNDNDEGGGNAPKSDAEGNHLAAGVEAPEPDVAADDAPVAETPAAKPKGKIRKR